ncbi:MAG TPA: hypothetical protein DHV69_01705, partial [Sphaerochaeta sp.]|nr:hypothetical protein [Sphaerochaeta sp.]
MKYTRFASIVVLFLVVASVAWGATGYDIKEMNSSIVISPEGVYQVDEHIAMDFHVPLHGFYRVLPVEYLFEDSQREDVKVRVTKVKASDTFTVMRDGSYITIRVGDANRTVVGSHRYDISYNYDIGADPHEEYDEFYYNIVGEDWEVPIGKFTFSITFPFPISSDRVSLTRGFWGSTTAQGLKWQLSGDGTVLTGESTRLEPGEAITVRVEMPDGYFTARKDWQAVYRIVFLVLSLVLVALAWYFWHAYGRDKDLIVVPRFEAPDGMSPLDVGYIIDESLDPRDVTSMIFYWA